MTAIALLTQDPNAYHALLGQSDIEASASPAEAEVWLAEPALAAEALRQGYKPRWLASTYAGVDPLMATDLPRDYQLTNIRGLFGPLMAQYVFAHLLSQLRHLPRYAAQQQQTLWQPHPYGTLEGQTLVLLGTGDIAQHIARAAKGFGMAVLGVSRSGADVAPFDRVYPVTQLHQALAQAQVLVSVLPATGDTHHLLNSEALACLPKDATLFNVGRGNVLDLDALLMALDSGQLAQAVLDVFEQEPVSADSPLWQHPQVTLTPHIAATSFPEQVVSQFADNLARYRRGDDLQHRIDFQRGY
ncbi:Phosphoglycerate dehydrogenase [Ferrimonas marina]|uniref:Phosphoglycerate dehydrogenase n=2 Tax=Ferrimonas marina TaxID=299255 RepID=A0A1M5XA72_9GAMM|nr:Phosphoglycerate dehydrogenase [Ferrimonas marina]